jgi:hypothetical protein
MAFSDTSKRRLFFALGIVLLLIAAAGMLLGQYNLFVRSKGLIALAECFTTNQHPYAGCCGLV